jgi:hypothetical protein
MAAQPPGNLDRHRDIVSQETTAVLSSEKDCGLQAAPVGGGSDARFVTREGRTARRLHAEREQAAQARWMVWWNCA